ncbi:MAG: Hpt domain-containing protein [Burkholderiales bacterium]
MEYATALLLAERAFENYSNLSPDFPRQVDAMLARLDAVRSGRAAPTSGAPMLDEMSKRAQERVLLAQVGREIQVNLRHMEQVLDAFFRDNAKRADLASLAKDSAQIRGALRILGLAEADRLLELCEQQIAQYADPDGTVSGEDLELLAESLSGLGFYIEAVEQQRPDRDRLIAPLIAKRLGEAPPPVALERDSVEAAVAELRATLPQLVEEVHRAPSDAAAREELKKKLVSLRDDAELIGDADLIAQVEAVQAELEAGDAARLAAAVDAIADTSAPAPEISEETQRLLATDGGAFDQELLEIYLLEASEVLDEVARNHKLLRDNPGDREALRTVRRGFHTLKGSGRMVGLTELGEHAYEVEKVFNRLIEEERPVTQAVQSMIDVAHDSFRHWVDALRDEGRVMADARPLHAAIAAVARELPGGAPVPPPSNVIELPRATMPPPAHAPETLEPPEPHPHPNSPAPQPPAAPGLELIELPELGFGGAEHEAVIVEHGEHAFSETIDVIEVPSIDAMHPVPTLTLVSDDAHAGGDAAVVAPLEPPSVQAPALHAVPEAEEAVESDEIAIGDVMLSRSLWSILVDEADQHLATLEHELSILQFDSQATPRPEMVRASHTLRGIHRTGGFGVTASLANSLEQALIALELRGPPMPAHAYPVLARAVAALRALVASVKDRRAFMASEVDEAKAAQRELDELRAEAAAAATDAEAVAMEEALLDEDQPAPEPLPVLESIPAPVAEAPSEAAPAVEIPAEAPAPVAVVDDLPLEIVLPREKDDPLEGIRDDVDSQVLSIFLDEAAELFPQAGEELRAWRRAPGDSSIVGGLRRTLHTFKGSARMAGAMRLGQLAHLMESRLEEGDIAATPQLFEALDEDLDHIAFVLDALRRGEVDVALPWVAARDAARKVEAATPKAAVEPTPEPVSAKPVPETASGPAQEAVPQAEPAPPPVAAAPVPPPAERPVVVPIAPQVPIPQAAPPSSPPPQRAEAVPELEAGPRAQLRVRADTIDRLVNEAGEVAIARARVEGELRALKANLLELTSSVIRLRSQMREIEIQAESQIQSQNALLPDREDFDPLEFDRYTRFQELTRSLAEGINDVSTVQQALLKNLDDADAALLAQARLSRDVQQRLFSIRTVPFSSLSERLYRIMRATVRELDKRANLEIHGAQVELDRSVLEKLVGPLEHLLRNALDHGIEPVDVRRAAGKSETGEIALTVRQVGNEIVIEIADDGGGINFKRVEERARSLGLVDSDAKPTEAQLVEHLFAPGFTTASKVTQISGRGIGMDVVRSEIGALGGRVEVASTAGAGTKFVLTLPLTLAVAQAVLVRAGARLWALPAPMVEQVQQVKSQALLDIYIQRKVEWQGRTYPFHYLPRLLGDNAHNPETKRYNSILLLRSGQNHAAIHIDEMIGNQEVVVKNIGPQLARVSGISGATVLGTGEIVLIINPVQLAARAEVPSRDAKGDDRAIGDRPRAPVVPVSTQPLVMIVDDSLTIRKITSRLLTRAGFAVSTARDGVDALQVLAEQVPDVILLDIEMPRMDGFEFAKTVKGDPKYQAIPIIMITSRTADKHRSHAAEIGVDLYLGKPYQEDELLKHLREMTGVAAL